MCFLKKIKAKLEDFLKLQEEWKAWTFDNIDYFNKTNPVTKQ